MVHQADLTVTETRNWSWGWEYNLQLSRSTCTEHFPGISHGDFLLLQVDHDGILFSVFGKVDIKKTNHLAPGQVGIGNNLRYAIGVTTGDEVQVIDNSPPADWTRQFDKILGQRPVLCRVRKAVHPDIGFEVCRLSEAAMDDLGITPGDHVVIESATEILSLKALPLREEIIDRKRRQTAQNSDRYPDPVSALDLDQIAGTDVDVPEIYLDSERRKDLGLNDQTEADESGPLASGVCQPVKVSRNSTSVYIRSLNEVTVPVVVGLLATVFVFDPWLGPVGKIAIVALGILFILLSITYHVRRSTIN